MKSDHSRGDAESAEIKIIFLFMVRDSASPCEHLCDEMPISTERTCNGCTICCKLVASPELDKPCGIWCHLCEIGVGCREYATRPPSCRSFRCMWLIDPGGIPEDFRPDKVKAIIVISNDEATPAVFCDRTPAGAFRRWLDMHSFKRRILLMDSRGMANKLIVNGKEIEVESEMIDINTMRWNPKEDRNPR